MIARNTVDYIESAGVRSLQNLEVVKHLEILDPLTLSYCGVEQCRPKFRFGPYIRDRYLIHVILSGKGRYRVGDKEFELSAGQAFLIRPEEETTYRADDQEPWKYAWIGFAGYKAPDVVKEMGFADGEYVIDLEQTDSFLQAVYEIMEARELSYAGELRRKSRFYEALTCLMENNAKQKQEKKEKDCDELRKKYVRRATEYMMTNYNKKIRISEMASEIGLNRSYLTNIFKKEMNMSPQDFLITFRLEKAAQLLRETNDSVRTIALNTGYDDSLSFSKAFKQKYNITPSGYRSTQPQLVEKMQNCTA